MLLGEQIVILLIKEKYLVKHIQSNGADSLYIDCPYIEQTLSSKSFDVLMFCGHYLLFTTLFGSINLFGSISSLTKLFTTITHTGMLHQHSPPPRQA